MLDRLGKSFACPRACGIWSVAVVVLAVASAAAGCVAEPPTERPRPSPTPGPPSIRVASTFTSQFDGRRWTFQVVVDPHGSPTDVSLEYGSGPTFDHVFVMAAGVLDAGQVSATTDAIPPDMSFCGSFTATNSFGSASLDAGCHSLAGLPGAPTPGDLPSASP